MVDNARRFEAVIAAIDAANACDPGGIEIAGRSEPAELVYGQRMSATLARVVPDASEHLRIAARGQHIERWTLPRKRYPEGRVGYLKWRNELKAFHARRLGEIMSAAGYGAGDIERVRSIVRKEQLKTDREAQLLEDVACLVFLRHYAESFAAKHEREKVLDILIKTQRKMSPRARAAGLDFGLSPPVLALYQQGLRALETAAGS